LTKTDKRIFDKFDYKEFALTDLEKQLNTPWQRITAANTDILQKLGRRKLNRQ
jgi:hypothetical protein